MRERRKRIEWRNELKENGGSNVGLLDLILLYYHQKRAKGDYLIETRK